ncbi:hypothetical protein C8J56DRAFT_1034899 [Mycena floridula]|nr:hypothetical protein C8J56DRAFT_1034899 [Mycena floridula]
MSQGLKLDEISSNLVAKNNINSRLTPIVDNTKLASLGLGAAQSKALAGYSGSEMQREICENEDKGLWMVSTELACFSTERPPTNWCIEDGKPFRSPRGSRLAILSVSQKSWPYTSRRMTRDSRAFNEEELEGTARAESKGFRFISHHDQFLEPSMNLSTSGSFRCINIWTSFVPTEKVVYWLDGKELVACWLG